MIHRGNEIKIASLERSQPGDCFDFTVSSPQLNSVQSQYLAGLVVTNTDSAYLNF